jgi:hypothetical protein
MLEQGTRGEHYVILTCVGQGGMSAMHAASAPELDRKVALNLLLSKPEEGDASAGRARLLCDALLPIAYMPKP